MICIRLLCAVYVSMYIDYTYTHYVLYSRAVLRPVLSILSRFFCSVFRLPCFCFYWFLSLFVESLSITNTILSFPVYQCVCVRCVYALYFTYMCFILSKRTTSPRTTESRCMTLINSRISEYMLFGFISINIGKISETNNGNRYHRQTDTAIKIWHAWYEKIVATRDNTINTVNENL